MGEGDSEAFSTIESDSDRGYSAHTNYGSSNDTLDRLEDEESDNLPTPEPEITELESPKKTTTADQHEERPPTPPRESPKEQEERPPTPPDRVLTPDDDVPYQYPKYRDDLDMEAHVYAFLQTWEANHVSQQLNDAKVERWKIAKFGMTLEGPAAWWHSKHLPGSITMFEDLRTKFLHFFHKQVDQREMVRQFYIIWQEPMETIQQFMIWF